MTVPIEFNVIGGLLGLGEYILLDVLSEIRLVSNAVQFLDYPISIINKEPDCIELIDIDGVQKKIQKNKYYTCTISLVQVLNNGIWTMEALFQNTKGYGVAIGIVRDSYDIPARACYCYQPHTDHIAAFSGRNSPYPVWYKDKGTYGNAGFDDNQILRLEFDSFKGTLILFIDNVQQPVYFSGIKEKVRFIIYMNQDGTSCTFMSLKQLIAPTSKQIANEVDVQCPSLSETLASPLYFILRLQNGPLGLGAPLSCPSLWVGHLKNKKANHNASKWLKRAGVVHTPPRCSWSQHHTELIASGWQGHERERYERICERPRDYSDRR
ncbi:MAG: hypothetical protein EZS28_013403 [Streblomastix strix]|uniref:Uncharacterized protein n=1 Tax=Streblomastix strix TaxID=222440 RepID=A0A5J4W9M9_9EUKA|nr:MAG: hypothetical protein EZS28_013403 [Streblomastix strix]